MLFDQSSSQQILDQQSSQQEFYLFFLIEFSSSQSRFALMTQSRQSFDLTSISTWFVDQNENNWTMFNNYFNKLALLKKIYKNEDKFDIIDDNFDFKILIFMTNANVLIFLESHTMKKFRLCFAIRSWFISTRIKLSSLFLTIFVSAWRTSSKISNKKDSI